MEKQPYESPRIDDLGTVRELTSLTACSGSLEGDLGSDQSCQIEQTG